MMKVIQYFYLTHFHASLHSRRATHGVSQKRLNDLIYCETEPIRQRHVAAAQFTAFSYGNGGRRTGLDQPNHYESNCIILHMSHCNRHYIGEYSAQAQAQAQANELVLLYA